MNQKQDVEVVAALAAILDELGIEYAVGGSMASSVYGKARFTQNADITVEPFESKAEQFYNAVWALFYISREAMFEALRQRGSFNLIHLEKALKIDIFVRKDTDFEKQLLLRRRFSDLAEGMQKKLAVVSAEDIVLLKLQGYRHGGCVSENQWNDVVGVIRVQETKLDPAYIVKWAKIIGINDLVQRALVEAENYA